MAFRTAGNFSLRRMITFGIGIFPGIEAREILKTLKGIRKNPGYHTGLFNTIEITIAQC